MLLTTLTIQDVPGGTFRLTSAGHNDFSFNIELQSADDSFIIEIWRDCGGEILKSQTETISLDHAHFSVYDVKDGEAIFWRNLNLDGGACTVTFDLVIIDDAASGTPAPVAQEEAASDPLKAYRIGATVTFGVYPQTIGKYSKFMENDIEWIILDVQGENALLISKYGLDTRRYHSDKRDMTRENCSLRQWLNVNFYQTAFRKTEKQCILATAVSADENPESRSRQSAVFPWRYV